MTEDNGKKRKCVNFTLKDKMNILKRLDAGASTTLVAQEYCLDPATIRRWRINRQTIEKENKDYSARKRMRKSRYEKLNNALYVWFREMRSRGLSVSGTSLKGKALELSTKLDNVEEFNANEGWLARFKKEYGIRQLSVTREKLSADKLAAENYKITFSQYISNENLLDCQIFNADETGLNYKLLPNKTLADRTDEKAAGFKQNKDRVTVLVCSNVDGSFKLPLLLIGKSANSRAFKNLSKNCLPVRYASQNSAWMTRQIFEDWFRNDFVPKVTDFLTQRNLPVTAILLLDNTPSHPSEEKLTVNNIKMHFLPPNVTSIIQPMDQGVIETLKRHYRLKLLQSLLTNQNDGLNVISSLKSVTMKEVIYWLSAAWDEITAESIYKCWKPLLNRPNQAENHIPTETHSHQNLNSATLNQLKRLNDYEDATMAEIDHWMACDNDPLSLMPSDDDIIQRASNNLVPEDETDDCENITPTTVPDALQAAKELIKYCEESGNIPLNDFMALRRIHDQVLIAKNK